MTTPEPSHKAAYDDVPTAATVTRHLIDQHGASVSGPRSPSGDPELMLHDMAHTRGDADHEHRARADV